MKNIVTSTIVRNATNGGGGMAYVARPLHAALAALGRAESLISGGSSEYSIVNGFSVGCSGGGFRKLPAPLMRSLVHIHGLWTPFELRAFWEARRRAAMVVISPHGALERWAFSHKRLKKLLAWCLYQKRLLQSADLLIVNSEQERRRLRALGLKPPIATIPNGVDLDGFDAVTYPKQRERTLLFFSRIDPKKGVPDLIDAWRLLKNRCGHSMHIHGHGDAAYVRRIKRKITESGCDDIAFYPPVFGPERWNVFKKASIYALPSYSENFGITVAEALAAGLPVITTHATPWGNLAHEGMGWIVDNDVLQLRDALASAIGLEPPILEKMRLKAQVYARQHFLWETIAERYAEVYDWISCPADAPPGYVDIG